MQADGVGPLYGGLDRKALRLAYARHTQEQLDWLLRYEGGAGGGSVGGTARSMASGAVLGEKVVAFVVKLFDFGLKRVDAIWGEPWSRAGVDG